MSVAKKDEVCGHPLGLRLGEPAAGVPIKKRPVFLSDKSVPSGMTLSMKPPSTPTGMSVSALGAGFSNEPVLNRSKSDIPSRSFTPSTNEKKGVLPNGSSEIPSRGESGRLGSVAPVARSQSHKFLTLDLQLAFRQNLKINSNSPVKKEKLDQGFSIFPSARPPKDVQTTSGMESSSNASLGKLSNLDLNVSLNPVDQLEGLPTMQAGFNIPHHTTFQHQKAQAPPVAPFSSVSSRLSLNIDNTVKPSNAYQLSNKSGSPDVTLDLQLKPPTRPELGISWKGLAPDPELSLSLSGNHTDEPKGLNVPDAIFTPEPVERANKISQAVPTPVSDKSPAEKISKPVACNVNPHTTMPQTVSGNVEIMPSNLVKKEPGEPTRQHIQNNVEKAPLFVQQRVGQASSSAEFEKTGNLNQVCGKSGFDLYSGNFPNGSGARNGLEVVTDSVPVQTGKLCGAACTEKFIKREEVTTAVPSPVIATVSGQSDSLIAKSLHLEVNQVHARKNVARKPCDVSRSSSNPTAESLVFNSLHRAVFDGMSQGSASMDFSEDCDNAVSQLPTTNKPHVESLGNSQITEVNDLITEPRKEDDSNMHHDCLSVTNKVHIQGTGDVKRVNTPDVIATHSGEEERESEVSVNGRAKDKQLLTSDKNSPLNKTDVTREDVKISAGASSANLTRPPILGTSGSHKIDSTRQSPKTFDYTVEKCRIPVIKSERSQSPDGKKAANCSESNTKIAAVKSEHGTEKEEIARGSNLQPNDPVLGEDSLVDGASTSQLPNESTEIEKDGQVNGSHWRDVANAYVNRNERWERFMQSERENNSEFHGGRDMNNQRRMDPRYRGRGGGYHGHPRNFRGPRMSDESEIDFEDEPIVGRRRPHENEYGHLHRTQHRRLRSPPHQMPGCLMREMEHDRFSGREIMDPRLLDHGQMDDVRDDMMEQRFFMPHPHSQHTLGDHAFIHRDRSHSPGQRRGAPVHFHRGRSPETMHRSPPVNRSDRPYLPHQRHIRRRGSPFDRVGHDDRGMQRNMKRCGMHQGVEGETFGPPLHPAQLAEIHAEAELTERRRFGERRAYRRSLERSPMGGDEEMLPYQGDGDIDFADGDGGPREPDGRFRNRMEHRARGEQEDGFRYRGPQGGCRDGNPNDSRSKKRRY
ncbi:hypothetical protein CFC21_057985 [Triticum aestivum]|uniref:Uncharacterized protein n=3 Tax=Triticum TaxID=4564 RepID=A0A9R0T4C9_TRITD|nr:hypothetical protein CFC21_057985 [Triticum aestivum]VAI06950.1 unnamed protein product [Triticum turgidum subsp. durum]